MPKNTRLLIVDDELGFYTVFRRMHADRYTFTTANSAARGLELLESSQFDAVLLDMQFTDEYDYDGGLYEPLPAVVAAAKNAFPIIIATYDNRKETTQIAQCLGAASLLRKSDYHVKIWEQQIQKIILEFKENQLTLTASPPKQSASGADNTFISVAPQMLDIKKRLQKYADYPKYSLLLLGEPGAGKEVLARYLHESKGKSDSPFIVVNLSAFNENIIESEIFGHVKGSFTDARADKTGYFEQAKGGTLFLDEIGEINTTIQVKLLRVLDGEEFFKVGDTKLIPLNTQLVFATNRDLKKAVAEGKFRPDFYDRIKGNIIHIPPLRERPEELFPLLDHFWALSCRRPSHPLFGKKARACFTKEALEKLQEYSWPGNVRELKHTVEELVFESDFQNKQLIDVDILPVRFKISRDETSDIAVQIEDPEKSSDIIPSFSQSIYLWPIAKQTAYRELAQIEKHLIAAGGRRHEAAKALGLRNDQALRYIVKKKYHDHFPELFEAFPIIRKIYKF